MKLRTSILLFFVFCLYYVHCALVKRDGNRDSFIAKCLEKRSSGDGICEESRYPISEFFYTCEVLGSFDSAPKRISIKNDSIFVALKRKTFSITNSAVSPLEVNTVIPPTGEVIDKLNNRFYNDYGSTYMVGKHDGKEVEIITSENDSLNELAMDYENNQLFILSLSIERYKKRSGSLYTLKTDQLVVDNTGKVKATKIEDFGKSFSALTIPKNSDYILLGVNDEKKGGKLIKLIPHKNDPCAAQMTKRNDFHKTLREATERLIKIFDEAINQNRNTGSVARVSAIDDTKIKTDQTEMRMLQMENQRLERKLNITTMKYESYTRKISSFTGSLKRVQSQPDITKVSYKKKIEKGNDLTCLPTREIEALKEDSLNFRNRVDLLENILFTTIQVLEDSTEPAESVETPDVPKVVSTELTETESDTEETPAVADDEPTETDEEYRARLDKFFGKPTLI